MPTVILILVIIIIPLILLINRDNSSKSGGTSFESDSPSDYDDETDYIIHMILTELDKQNPNLSRLKDLRKRMKFLRDDIADQPDIAKTVASSDNTVDTTKTITSSGNTENTAKNTPTAVNEKNDVLETLPKKASLIVSDNTDTASNGIVVALYAGSLLLLAGVGGLVGSGQGMIGLPLLILLAIAFYGGGIAMRHNKKFRSICHVFVGTGMAIIPFVGVLFYNLTLIDPRIIWLVFSIIGIPVLILATYIMNNRIFSYFAIAGFVSLSCSMSSVLGLSATAYFMLVMAIGIVCDLLSLVSNSSKLGIMFDTVRITGEWLPLATLVSSLLASPYISELQYLLMLTIIIIQLAINYWRNNGVIRESLLRLTIPIWIVMAVNLMVPTAFATGITLAAVTTMELILSFFMLHLDKKAIENRRRIETPWLIAVMLSFVVAGFLIGGFLAPNIWIALSCALLADIAVALSARFLHRSFKWYYTLIPIGIALPVTIANMLGLPWDGISTLCYCFYLVEIAVMSALSWTIEDKAITGKQIDSSRGDALTIVSIILLGIAAFVVKMTSWSIGIISLVAAIAIGLRGWIKNNRSMAEPSIYLIAFSVISFAMAIASHNPGVWVGVFSAHIVFISLLITSLMRDDELKSRQVVGSIGLLSILGAIALGGVDWTMILFMVEAVAILIYGLAIKQRRLWITGAVALALAVLWFTRKLSFVWPALMGLGIITVVILIIARGDKKH